MWVTGRYEQKQSLFELTDTVVRILQKHCGQDRAHQTSREVKINHGVKTPDWMLMLLLERHFNEFQDPVYISLCNFYNVNARIKIASKYIFRIGIATGSI